MVPKAIATRNWVISQEPNNQAANKERVSAAPSGLRSLGPQQPLSMSPSEDGRKRVGTSCRRSARLQSKPPISYCPPKQVLTERKDPKEDRKVKPEQSELPPPIVKLTRENLREFNRQNMGQKRKAGELGREQTPLLTVTHASEPLYMSSTPTQIPRSSKNITDYRYISLARAHVLFGQSTPPDIQTIIDNVTNPQPTKERQSFLAPIATRFYNECLNLTHRASLEISWRSMVYRLIDSLLDRKLGIDQESDWRSDLKPPMPPQPTGIDFRKLLLLANENGRIEPPLKRQRFDDEDDCPAPNDALSSAAEGPSPSTIKTPRPDITVAIQQSTLVSELATEVMLQHPHLVRAQDASQRFIATLNKNTDMQGGAMKPLLMTTPTDNPSTLIDFPFAIVECKAYSTGRQLFEAQNQAAGAGACGLNLQLSLNELVERSTGLSASSSEHPLFFSICSEGPLHELWVHYVVGVGADMTFNMKLLRCCNAMLPDEVDKFVVAVDNVLRWGADDFLKSVVRRLALLANAAMTPPAVEPRQG